MGKKQELLDAAREGNLQEVSRLLSTGPSAVSAMTATVGKVAQKVGVKVVPLVNKSDENGATALHLASLEGYIEVVRLLLANDAQISALDNRNCSVLHYACYRGRDAVLNELISHAKSTQAFLTSNNTNRAGNRASVQQGATTLLDLNGQNADGETALHVAALFNHAKCITALLEQGANPLLVNQIGETPLDVAVRNGHIRAARQLAAHIPAAVKRIRKVTGHSALHEAAKRGDVRMLRTLIDSGFEVNAVNELGSALHVAALCRKVDAFAFLLSTDTCDMQLRDSTSKTVHELLDEMRHANATSASAESVVEILRLMDSGVEAARLHISQLSLNTDNESDEQREPVGILLPLAQSSSSAPTPASASAPAEPNPASAEQPTARAPRPPRPTTRPVTMMTRSPAAATELSSNVHIEAGSHRSRDDLELGRAEPPKPAPLPKARTTKVGIVNQPPATRLGVVLSTIPDDPEANKQDSSALEAPENGNQSSTEGQASGPAPQPVAPVSNENNRSPTKPVPANKPKLTRGLTEPSADDNTDAGRQLLIPSKPSANPQVSPDQAQKSNTPLKPAPILQPKPVNPPVHAKPNVAVNQTSAETHSNANPPPVARKPLLAATTAPGASATSLLARFPCLPDLTADSNSNSHALTPRDLLEDADVNESMSLHQIYESEHGSLLGWLSQLDLEENESAFISTGFNSLAFINGVLDAKDLNNVLPNASLQTDPVVRAVGRLPKAISELRRRDFASVNEWLAALELDALYTSEFLAAGYTTMAQCYAIWPSDLTRIGVSLLGHRRRILESLYALKEKLADSLLPGTAAQAPLAASALKQRAHTWWPLEPHALVRGYYPFRVVLISTKVDNEERICKQVLFCINCKFVKFFDAATLSPTNNKPLPLIDQHETAAIGECTVSEVSAAQSLALSVKPPCTAALSYRAVAKDKNRASVISPKPAKQYTIGCLTREQALQIAKTLAQACEIADALFASA